MTTLTLAVITLFSLYLFTAVSKTIKIGRLNKKQEELLESKGLFKVVEKYYYKGRYFEVKGGKVFYKDNKGITSLTFGEGHIDLIISLIDFEEDMLTREMSGRL